MSWLQLKFTVARAHVPAVTEALEACGALSVTIEGREEEHRLQSALEETPLWSENRVVGLFDETVDAATVAAAVRDVVGGAVPHETAELPDADWARAWMVNYRPLQITPGLWICPSWCPPPDPAAVNLLLDPGLAFGTGTHPTTALCLRWLAEQRWAGQTVVDYGCGSGILAIAALKLGAQSAIGVDVDPQALAVSRDNAARNGVGDNYRACLPAELPRDDTASIVLANILAGTLVELASELTQRVRPGGRIALSGVLTGQADEVSSRYARHFALETREQDGWVLLSGIKLS